MVYRTDAHKVSAELQLDVQAVYKEGSNTRQELVQDAQCTLDRNPS